MIGAKLKVQGSFFYTPAVMAAMEKNDRAVQSKMGAYIRTRARSSIRKAPRVNAETGLVIRGRKGKNVVVKDAVSEPGRPPFSHKGQLRKFLFFAYDLATKSTVVGPALFEGAKIEGTPPRLEFGGKLRLEAKNGKTRSFVVKPRPFMKPALDAELPRFAPLYSEQASGPLKK